MNPMKFLMTFKLKPMTLLMEKLMNLQVYSKVPNKASIRLFQEAFLSLKE